MIRPFSRYSLSSGVGLFSGGGHSMLVFSSSTSAGTSAYSFGFANMLVFGIGTVRAPCVAA